MTAAALDRLIAREEALIVMLDSGDAAQLEHASHALAQTLGDVAASGAWRGDAALSIRVRQALRLAEAARARIFYLADRNRRRLERLTALAGAPLAQAYSRHGRMR